MRLPSRRGSISAKGTFPRPTPVKRGELNAFFRETREAQGNLHDTVWDLADTALLERDRYRQALEEIRDHGNTHDQPCYAITNGDCADVMQEIARAVLDA